MRPSRSASPMVNPSTLSPGRRFMLRPGWWRCSWQCRRTKDSTGCGPTPTDAAGRSPRWPPISWNAGYRCAISATRQRTCDDVATDYEASRPASAAQTRLAIAALTSTLTTNFDLPTLLDTVVENAQVGFAAHSAVVLLLDHRPNNGNDTEIQIVAQAQRSGSALDLTFQRSGPGLISARDGAVAMIADLADTQETRWEAYCAHAASKGLRSVRAFPIISFGTSVGSMVVHTEDPWGAERPNDFGQTLANLVAVALSLGTTDSRRTDTVNTINHLLHGITAIATATGVIAEISGVSVDDARLQLQRLARSHGQTATTYARAVLAAQRAHPDNPAVTGILRPPPDLTPPQRIDS
ncbi:hypothetical protein C6A85_000000111685 [Mycobacterium sp. ITM-2017-0098]|nr:hypothetical protein C6A85_000000111685 [Mycobacterium sp. ITM-2017-0098]